MTDITITSADGGTFGGYLALPPGGRGPGLVVAQEIFGVNQVMRALCDGFAEAGYVALCPDLFWRQQPGVMLTDQTDEEWQQAFALMQGFDVDHGVKDLQATIDTLRQHDATTGRVAGVGYCLGGKLAYLMATRTDVDAAVSYYGVGIEALLGEASKITKPLLMHVAEEDGFVPKEAQIQMRHGLAALPNVTMHSYPGCDHAFARVGGAHYDAEAATLANDRTAAFLRDALA